MQMSRVLLVTLICVVAAECVHAQRSRVTRSQLRYSAPKVRGHKAKIVCPTFEKSAYPYHGVGFKFGDPFAFTYKYYPNKRFSFAMDVGKAASGLYSTYFREKFAGYIVSDTFPSGEPTLTYQSHRARTDLVGELKAMYHLDGNQNSDGLRLYAGAGWEWKYTKLVYDYEESDHNFNEGGGPPFGSFTRNRMTMGPQLVLGIEYADFGIPVSAFMEAEYFIDVKADPGWQRFEGGVGLRYIF